MEMRRWSVVLTDHMIRRTLEVPMETTKFVKEHVFHADGGDHRDFYFFDGTGVFLMTISLRRYGETKAFLLEAQWQNFVRSHNLEAGVEIIVSRTVEVPQDLNDELPENAIIWRIRAINAAGVQLFGPEDDDPDDPEEEVDPELHMTLAALANIHNENEDASEDEEGDEDEEDEERDPKKDADLHVSLATLKFR